MPDPAGHYCVVRVVRRGEHHYAITYEPRAVGDLAPDRSDGELVVEIVRAGPMTLSTAQRAASVCERRRTRIAAAEIKLT